MSNARWQEPWCLWCGGTISGYGRSTYCTAVCSELARAKMSACKQYVKGRNTKKKWRTCRICGEPIPIGRRVFCSDHCAWIHKNATKQLSRSAGRAVKPVEEVDQRPCCGMALLLAASPERFEREVREILAGRTKYVPPVARG